MINVNGTLVLMKIKLWLLSLELLGNVLKVMKEENASVKMLISRVSPLFLTS